MIYLQWIKKSTLTQLFANKKKRYRGRENGIKRIKEKEI